MSAPVIRRRHAFTWFGLAIYLAYGASVQQGAANAVLCGIGIIALIAAGLLTIAYGQ